MKYEFPFSHKDYFAEALKYFKQYPNALNAMDFADYKRANPASRLQSFGNLKSTRTRLINLGLL